jgi:PDZ domain
MARFLLLPALFLANLIPCARAQDSNPVKPSGLVIAPSLGVRLGTVPDLLYEQFPQLKRGEGVVVEEVQAGSAAARAGLRRHDLLLTYGGQAIQGLDHFHQLIRAGAADQSRPLVLLRGGREMTLQVPLASNPPKAMIKPGGPPAVNVEAQRLAGGRLQITFTYYSQGTGKLEKLKCSGSLADIENEVRQLGKQNQMPSRVQDLVEVALRQIRLLNFPHKD